MQDTKKIQLYKPLYSVNTVFSRMNYTDMNRVRQECCNQGFGSLPTFNKMLYASEQEPYFLKEYQWKALLMTFNQYVEKPQELIDATGSPTWKIDDLRNYDDKWLLEKAKEQLD